MSEHDEIRLERFKQRISQWDLAKIVGIHPATISKYESGQIELSRENVQKLREALGLVKVEK